ncbi:MAG: hypothetical protein Q9170_003521 [Blastenia crenularia]
MHIVYLPGRESSLASSPTLLLCAYTSKSAATTRYIVTNTSPVLLLLRNAPIIFGKDRYGNQKTIEAGIYLDHLPAEISRPKLTRVKATGADAAAQMVAMDLQAAAMKGWKPGKKTLEVSTTTITKITKVKKERKELAAAPLHRNRAVAPAALAPGGAPIAQAKGLEIDMVPEIFMAVAMRSSRLKKRPARFDGGAEEAVEKKQKRSARL